MLLIKYALLAASGGLLMVPMDGKFFFTNDVLRGNPMAVSLPKPDQP